MFGLFVIEAGSEPVAVTDRDGKPIVFDNGTDAAAEARGMADGRCWSNGYQAVKCQPRRLANDAWKARELGRFADGTYVALPWADLPTLSSCADHFAHVSTEDGAKIAYTQDASKGAGDIQTRVKPGKYLQQFYSAVFDAAAIARMSAEFSNQYGESNELLFADTEEAIVNVYINGPHSCMAHDASRFDSSVHPCSIYAAGDLAVAYMVRNGDITARALCWPAKKLYGRVYGDDCRLTDLLESASFSPGKMYGAKLLRIEERDGFVMPYVDGHEVSESDDGEFLLLAGHGHICAGNQNGLSGSTMECCNCSTGIDEDNCQSDDNGNYYCDDCYSDAFGYCDRLGGSCDRDTMAEVIVQGRRGTETQDWSERAQERYAFTCEGSGKMYCNDLLVTLADGTQWSQDYFEDNGFTCEGDGECCANDDMIQLEDGTCWSKDYFADNGVTVDGVNYAKGDEPQDDSEDDGEASEAVVERPYRGSPTVKCDAQIEMPLDAASEGRWLLQPYNGEGGGWEITRTDNPWLSYRYQGYFEALDALSVLKSQDMLVAA